MFKFQPPGQRRDMNGIKLSRTLVSMLLLASAFVLVQASLSYGSNSVIADRIDARPAGHPLDSGGMDPIMDWQVERGMFPTMIRVPDWIPIAERPDPNAQYYLYYGAHSGKHIKMAWSDSLTGEWTVWNPSGGGGVDQAWGVSGNNTGAQTPGHGVLDMAIGDPFNQEIFDLGNSVIEDHISSPEVIVDDVNQRIVLLIHGHHDTQNWPFAGSGGLGHDTFAATSNYGLNFNLPSEGGETGHGLRDVVLARPYARIIEVDGEANGQQVNRVMSFGLGGQLNLAPIFLADGVTPATFANADQPGGLFNPNGTGYNVATDNFYWENVFASKPYWGALRHPDVIPTDPYDPGSPTRNGARHLDVWYDADTDRNTVYFFYHAAGDMPESILMVRMSLEGLTEEERLDPLNWVRIDEQEQLILTPELIWEGVDLELKPSQPGSQSQGRALRDPNIFMDDDGKIYMVYVGRGEQNIGIAELTFLPVPEPTSVALLGLGGLLALRRRRRSRG